MSDMWTPPSQQCRRLLLPPSAMLALLIALAWVTAPAVTEQAAVPTAGHPNALRLDHSFFLKQIFDKYGNDGVMTFEGFEHLLESLGLARVAFDKRHGVALHRSANGTFRDVHDALRLHLHDHAPSSSSTPAPSSSTPAPSSSTPALTPTPEGEEEARGSSRRRRRALPAQGTSSVTSPAGTGSALPPVPLPRCLSPRDMLVTFGLEANHGVSIDADRFLHLCPVIVYELDQRSCFLAAAPAPRRSGPHPSAWMLASLSVLAASCVGLVAAAVAGRLLGRWRFVQAALDFLMAVGAGTLCGDALLHLLPHALSGGHEDAPSPDHSPGGAGSERSHPQEAVLRAAAAFGTVAALFALETLLHRLNANEDGKKTEKKDYEETRKGAINADESGVVLGSSGSDDESRGPEACKMLGAAQGGGGGHGHSHGGGAGGAMVWMVQLGDCVHNLTDGLAIGAAFCSDPVAGFATALAVFCHELPHEFGDFAVLLKSGMSLRRALFFNVVSSILSFIGMAIGVWVGNFDAASQWIYAITAGSFLYIALADLIPELSRNSNQSKTSRTAILQLFGVLLGGGIMLVIALYEDALRAVFE